MSLILILVYWLVIPALVLLAAVTLWRRARTPFHKGLVAALGVAILSGLLWSAQGEKWLLDRQVRELCARDGGIKVYETVELSKNEFNEFGQVSFYQAAPGSVLLNDYELIKKEHTYHSGNPRMWRTHFAIKRKNDGKILGESVGYTRFGDGFEGPFHPSSFSCPDQFGEVSLLQRVFPSKTLISR